MEPRLDFRNGQAIKGLELDDVLTGLVISGERASARSVDLEKKAEFQLTFGRGIRELVVYTPADRPDVIAVEPYTQTADAITLQSQGIDAGLRVRKHGAQDTLTITMGDLGQEARMRNHEIPKIFEPSWVSPRRNLKSSSGMTLSREIPYVSHSLIF